MGLELYMVGVIVEDMPRAVEFYRRLGFDIPEGEEHKAHVEVKMSGMTFFLTTRQLNARWDAAREEISGTGYRMILEFYLETRAAVDAKVEEMLGYGYKPHGEPRVLSNDMYFAFVDDPDGNTILLSAFDGAAA
jgi:predicted lactoylglutathione lyase